MSKLEFRETCEIRALDTQEDGKMVIEGVVNKVGEWSKTVKNTFKERIEEGVFTRALESAKEKQRDIFLLALHNNRELPLASVQSGTMQLEERDGALHIRAELPPTTLAKDIYALVQAGVLKDFSFGFNQAKSKWGKDTDGLHTRSIESMELYEVSIVSTGAYNDTSIQARSLDVADIMPKDEEPNKDEEVYLYNKNKLKLKK